MSFITNNSLNQIKLGNKSLANLSINRKKRKSESAYVKIGHFFKNKVFSNLYLIIALLVALTASPSIYASIKNVYDIKEQSDSGVNSLMSAVASNDVDGVKFFVKTNSESINQKNLGGATALHIACREGNLEIAKILIDNGANIDATDNEGWTPLMRAALAGNLEITNLLLDKGAKASSFNSSQESALIHVVSSDCNECLVAILQKFDFVKSMNIADLKTQLSEAFISAKNRDNQEGQNIISAYLNHIAQLVPLDSVDSNNFSGNASSAKGGKKFIFKSDGNITSVTEQTEPVEEISIVNKDEGSFVQRDLIASGKRFKFLVGEEGKPLKMAKKFSVKKIADNKIGVTKSEPVAAAVVLTKDKQPVSEAELQTAAPVKGVVYKFFVGPEAKVKPGKKGLAKKHQEIIEKSNITSPDALEDKSSASQPEQNPASIDSKIDTAKEELNLDKKSDLTVSDPDRSASEVNVNKSPVVKYKFDQGPASMQKPKKDRVRKLQPKNNTQSQNDATNHVAKESVNDNNSGNVPAPTIQDQSKPVEQKKSGKPTETEQKIIDSPSVKDQTSQDSKIPDLDESVELELKPIQQVSK